MKRRLRIVLQRQFQRLSIFCAAQTLGQMQSEIDAGRDASRSDAIAILDHTFRDHFCAKSTSTSRTDQCDVAW